MLDQFHKQAIRAALDQDWNRACLLNQKILKTEPKNISALNRLAKAKIELGSPTEAKTFLYKVISQDKFNSIALSNLEKIKTSKKNHPPSSSYPQTISFIEEPGKTKSVNLVNLGEHSIINCLQSGQQVYLHPLKRKIKILNQNKKYLGSLPEDISLTLTHHLRLGSKFQAFIRLCSPRQISIFIKETKKSARLKGISPFPATSNNSIILKHHTPMNSPLEIYDPETEID